MVKWRAMVNSTNGLQYYESLPPVAKYATVRAEFPIIERRRRGMHTFLIIDVLIMVFAAKKV